MPGDIGGVRRGPSSPVATTYVLEAADDGRKGGRLLQDGVPGSAWGVTGRSTLPHYIYCGGGCSGAKLGDIGDSGRVGAGRAWKGG